MLPTLGLYTLEWTTVLWSSQAVEPWGDFSVLDLLGPSADSLGLIKTAVTDNNHQPAAFGKVVAIF